MAEDINQRIQNASDRYMKALVDAVANNELGLAQALVTRALSGDMAALKEINERVLVKRSETPAPQKVPISDERLQEILDARESRKAAPGTAPRVSTDSGAVSAAHRESDTN